MKKIVALLLSVVLLLPQMAFANEATLEFSIKDLVLAESEHVSGTIPLFQGDEDIVGPLNKIIAHIYESAVAELSEKQSVIFSYETIIRDVFTSILIHLFIPGENTSHERINTLVLETSNFSIQTLESMLGVNAYKLANGIIARQIALAEEGTFFTGTDAFRGLYEGQSFYLDADGNVVIVFDKYTIAPGATGIPRFEIPMNSVVNFEITSQNVLLGNTEADGEFIFVPLRAAAEALGYAVSWDEETRGITITRGGQSHSIAIGNPLFEDGNIQLAPILDNGRTFVPLSFFELVLSAYYTVDGSNITISGITQ